ncbi:MAG: SDR family NAD(P)-dependent oxidoreductase [Waddliaceae bacterium]
MIQTALVTGATSGIGKELCHLLLKQGVSLIATGRDAKELEKYEGAITLISDLTQVEDRKKLVSLIHEKKPDLVINNAGIGLYGDALDSPISDQMQLVEVNINALTELTLEAVKMMSAHQKMGVVLNVSSVAGFLPFPGNAAYAASKAFVTNFSVALDFECREKGIRILAACPGMVDTAFRTRAGGKEPHVSKSGVMSARYAANQILWQIKKRKPVHIFDWKYRVGVFLMTYILPTAFTSKMMHGIILKRK